MNESHVTKRSSSCTCQAVCKFEKTLRSCFKERYSLNICFSRYRMERRNLFFVFFMVCLRLRGPPYDSSKNTRAMSFSKFLHLADGVNKCYLCHLISVKT